MTRRRSSGGPRALSASLSASWGTRPAVWAGAARGDAPPALAAWAVCVWAVWLAAVVGAVLLLVATGVIASGPHHGMPGVVREGAWWPLRSWDAAWYERIAAAGYPADRVAREDAFFPLWPGVLWVGGRLGAAL